MRIVKILSALLIVCTVNLLCYEYLIPDKASDNKLNISSIEIRAMKFTSGNSDIDKIVSQIVEGYDLKYDTELQVKKYVEKIVKDVTVFPVAYSEKSKFVEYCDSWGYVRTYGGNRCHEGTDIMAMINNRGYYPLVACCDGVVEEMGWLELGGYRIGIRSTNGLYLYYAHLYKYRDGLNKGDYVKRGELIGYMGDSGYSKVPGTTGNFDVHLHFGIYIDTPEYGQIAINPYYFLKRIENERIIYDY